MNKHNLLIKKIKKQFLSINYLIETYFNRINVLKTNFKKGNLIRNNRVFLSLAIAVILTLSYFLLPTLYNKNLIQEQIENQIYKKYGLRIKFNEKITYRLLPKPHFSSKNLTILQNEKKIASVDNFKILMKINEFFPLNQIQIKDLIFNKADFYIVLDDLFFFKNLLKTEPNENIIIFRNSNIFFKSNDDELLFLKKIKDGKFYYDSYNLQNILVSKNEIFNIPYKMIIKNDKFNKNILAEFKSNKIRLNVDNKISYESEIKDGILNVSFINKSSSLNYQIKKNSINFESQDQTLVNGSIDFKPFYFQANFDYDGISIKDLFDTDSILIDLIKSEIFNNENLNVNINLNVRDITNIDELNNLSLILALEQGAIGLSKSKIMWKDDLEVIMNEGFIRYDNEEGIIVIGKITINAKDIKDFYKSFQIEKIHRNEFKKINLDFVYNFNKNKFRFDNIKIDNNSNEEIEKFITKYNSSEKNFSNKITFKNFINNFFSVYDG